MAKDRHQKHNLLIQYRSGASIGRRISAEAELWGVTPSEAGKRLAVLALLGLTKDNYEILKRLEDGPGVDDFGAACGQAIVALDVHERMSARPGGSPLGPQERMAFLHKWVSAFVGGHSPKAGTVEPQAETTEATKPEGFRNIRRDV